MSSLMLQALFYYADHVDKCLLEFSKIKKTAGLLHFDKFKFQQNLQVKIAISLDPRVTNFIATVCGQIA